MAQKQQQNHQTQQLQIPKLIKSRYRMTLVEILIRFIQRADQILFTNIT